MASLLSKISVQTSSLRSLGLVRAITLPWKTSIYGPLRAVIGLWGNRYNLDLAHSNERLHRAEAWLAVPLATRLALRRFIFSPWGMLMRAVGMVTTYILVGMAISVGIDSMGASEGIGLGMTGFIGAMMSVLIIPTALMIEGRLQVFAPGPIPRFLDFFGLRFAREGAQTSEERVAILNIVSALARAKNPDVLLERVRVELGEADLRALLRWMMDPWSQDALQGGELSEALSRVSEVLTLDESLRPLEAPLEAPRMQTVWR